VIRKKHGWFEGGRNRKGRGGGFRIRESFPGLPQAYKPPACPLAPAAAGYRERERERRAAVGREIIISRKAKKHKGRKGNRKARPFPDCSSHSFPLGSKSLWIPWKVPASFRDQRPELLNS